MEQHQPQGHGRVRRGQLMEVEEFKRPQILARSNVFCVDTSHTKPHVTGTACNNIRPTGFPTPSHRKRASVAQSKAPAATNLWFPPSTLSSSAEPPLCSVSGSAPADVVPLRQIVLGARKHEVHKLPDRHVGAQQRREEADHLLGQLEKARRFRPRDDLEGAGDHDDDDLDLLGNPKRAVALKKVHALKLHIVAHGTMHAKRRPHYYSVHLPEYDEPRSLAIELKSNVVACSMDVYVVYGTERTPGPSCFDWRAISGTALLIHPAAPNGVPGAGDKLRPGNYTLAVYSDRAPLGYSVLCATLPYKDSTSQRHVSIARSALQRALQKRLIESESRRVQCRNSKEVQEVHPRPHSALASTTQRPGADGAIDIHEVLGERETVLLKTAIGDDKTVEGLCDTLLHPEPFNMSSRMVSVNELAFNPDKIRSDIVWLLSTLGASGTAQSREALSQIDVMVLADRLTSSVLDEKLSAPTTKILAPPSRPTSALSERFENRANLAYLKSIDSAGGLKMAADKKGAGMAGAKPAPRVKWPQRALRARSTIVERKMMVVKNLYGGLPQTTLGVLSVAAQDFRTHSWEDMRCRLDESSALWADPVEVEKIDMGTKLKDKDAKPEGPRVLCVLQDLLSVEEAELPDQPSCLYCFRLNFDSGPIIFAAHSEEDRKSWVRAAQLFGESAEIAAFGGVESIENSELVKRAKEIARAKLAAARQAEAAGRRAQLEAGRVIVVDDGEGSEELRTSSAGSLRASAGRGGKPRPSSAFAGSVTHQSEHPPAEDRHPQLRPASAMHRPASAMSMRADVSEGRHTRPASALARTGARGIS